MSHLDYINSLLWVENKTILKCFLCNSDIKVNRTALLKTTRQYYNKNGSMERFRYRCCKCNPKGEKCSKWKGGKVFRRKYIGIHKSKVPLEYQSMCNDGGCYILEHRLVVAMREGRCLLPTEHVHHIDLNPENNSPENLMLIDSWTHTVITKLNKIILEKDKEIQKLKKMLKT